MNNYRRRASGRLESARDPKGGLLPRHFAGVCGSLRQGGNMSHPKQAAQGSAATAQRTLKFDEMMPLQKLKFVLKVAVCMISFGFIYPHILD
jgi:hypothetical protein